MTEFVSLLDIPADQKGAALLAEVTAPSSRCWAMDCAEFGVIPTSPFAYWASEDLVAAFAKSDGLGAIGATARQGLSTADDFRFLRLDWEVAPSKAGIWPHFAKGGAYSKYLGPIHLRVNWAFKGKELAAAGAAIRNADYYARPGLTWSRRSQKGLSVRVLPAGCVFADKGPAVFVANDDRRLLFALSGILNSPAYGRLVKLQMAFGSFEIGVIQRTPLPDNLSDSAISDAVSKLCRSLTIKQSTIETAPHFVLPECLVKTSEYMNLPDPSEYERQANRHANKLYKFVEEVAVERVEAVNFLDQSELDGDEAEPSDIGEDASLALLSWSVGVAFGRFDIRLATDERELPPQADPFDPLPAKSPGMLPDGLAPFMSTPGVFVDDPGHPEDLTARVTAVYERVGETPPTPDELRLALAKEFFPAHIRMYSKSRRKAPIYWQLATASASYSVWLYIHAFSKDTLFRVQNDYVAPKLAHERRQLESLLADAGPSPSSAQARAIESQQTFVEELSAFLDEVRRVAPLWDPDLDDGVLLNFAPLWRLVPQNRAWQKELRAAWASLVAGDYDWARLAMRLWPKRVLPKCAKDRGLAIAHDLEDVFWFEDAAGKWQARSAPSRSINDLIAERTSPAVEAALQSLLEAPDLAAASGRGRRRRNS